jgi:hypothetical protein
MTLPGILQTGTTSESAYEASKLLLSGWLQPASVAETFTALSTQRYVDTCQWIYHNADFKTWQGNQSQHLWICGKPGAGKSVLAASIIEYLQLENITAYFFCKLADDNQNTLESIMRTWLWQLLQRMPHFTKFALANYLNDREIRSGMELVMDTLQRIISQCETTIYLVLDGLDECQSGPTSADKLMEFAANLGPNARLVIVSRPENWIQKAINARLKSRYCTVQVTSMATDQDLSRWIHDRVLTMDLRDPELEQLAISNLQKSADGMFLWARFQLEALESQLAVEDARMALKNELPKDLEAIYERLWMNIHKISNDLRRSRAFRILQWITAATRPLTIAELDFALGIQIDAQINPPRKTLLRGELDVLEACGSFVEITKAGQISFVHASAKDFLSKKGIQFGLAYLNSTDQFQKSLDAMYIVRACITSLSCLDDNFQKHNTMATSLKEQLQSFLERYPFLSYATMNWWKHLDVPFIEKEVLWNSTARFLGSSENTVRWLQLYQYLLQFHPAEDEFVYPKFVPGWQYIQPFWDVHLGTNETNLFDRWDRWHIEMWFGKQELWPSIQLAAFFDFADIVENELQSGVSVDHRGSRDFTPLLRAALGDSPNSARILISHGADLKAQTSIGYSAIRYAGRNSLSVLPLLLNAGSPADMAEKVTKYTALHEISGSVLWHPRILHVILEMPNISEMINAKDIHETTPLHRAAAIQVNSSARRLCSTDHSTWDRSPYLDIISKVYDKCGATGPKAFGILHQAWQDLGVDTPKGPTFESMVEAVTIWKIQIVQKLLEKGADRSCHDKFGRTPQDVAVIVGSSSDPITAKLSTILDPSQQLYIIRTGSQPGEVKNV